MHSQSFTPIIMTADLGNFTENSLFCIFWWLRGASGWINEFLAEFARSVICLSRLFLLGLLLGYVLKEYVFMSVWSWKRWVWGSIVWILWIFPFFFMHLLGIKSSLCLKLRCDSNLFNNLSQLGLILWLA